MGKSKKRKSDYEVYVPPVIKQEPNLEVLQILEQNREMNAHVVMSLFNCSYDEAVKEVCNREGELSNVPGMKKKPWALPFMALMRREPVSYDFGRKEDFVVFCDERRDRFNNEIPQEVRMYFANPIHGVRGITSFNVGNLIRNPSKEKLGGGPVPYLSYEVTEDTAKKLEKRGWEKHQKEIREKQKKEVAKKPNASRYVQVEQTRFEQPKLF